MSTNIVLWTGSAPDPLTDALTAAGYRVWEALAISEVTYLCETENIHAVVIKPEVDGRRAAHIAQHILTVRLKPMSSVNELIDALWQLFPVDAPTTLQ